MAEQFAWAIFNHRGRLVLLSGQCPIFWNRKVAQAERARKLPPTYRVAKVRIQEVVRREVVKS